MDARACVLVTGASGFVGKVVLEELLRRRDELRVDSVVVLIRPRTDPRSGTSKSARARFDEDIASSACFAKLPPGWQRACVVVEGDLSQEHCGLDEATRDALISRITHVLHCAASVEFDLPIAEAAAANIDGSLRVLELAKACPGLRAMVSVSTAYVTPFRREDEPIEERLVPLPADPDELLAAIREGRAREEDLLRATGHPNTYTYTKCLAEHLLVRHRGHVPLAIVRPSIISACLAQPFPAWIDSAAAYTGWVLYAGIGVIRAFPADPSKRLDVVPCDEVATRIIDSGLVDPPSPRTPEVPIVHAVAGRRLALRIDLGAAEMNRFFSAHPSGRGVDLGFLGTDRHGFVAADLRLRRAPMLLARAVLAATGDGKARRKLERVDARIAYMGEAFRYFSHRTFDFRSSAPLDEATFEPAAYLRIMCQGIHRHLLGLHETEVTIAGARDTGAKGDLAWVASRPGSAAQRAIALALRKGLRACTERVTFDRPSFERAVEQAADGSLFVLLPSHRSYLDFLLCAYLPYAHPELGIPVPHVAAADDFARLPLLGSLFARAQAFYVRRGAGEADPELTRQVHEIVASDASLLFFLEGQRSRSRRALPPRRGLLRALQATRRAFTLLPIAVTYDRVPEEASFEEELGGGAKRPMKASALLPWARRALAGEVRLGRVHVACGVPVPLDRGSDVREAAARVLAAQQRATVATTFHLRAFLARCGVEGLDAAWLARAIEARGGKVVESALDAQVPASVERSMRQHWMHWFYDDAAALLGADPVVARHVEEHGHARAHEPHGGPAADPDPSRDDPRLRMLLRALFEDERADHLLVARLAASCGDAIEELAPQAVVRAVPSAWLPHVESAFAALERHGVLAREGPNATYQWGPRRRTLTDVARAWEAP
jgi:nucleoside-diphosphate-sugar epimerase/1-acyl-sn-glycerol-3-phosphate acyltransferase